MGFRHRLNPRPAISMSSEGDSRFICTFVVHSICGLCICDEKSYGVVLVNQDAFYHSLSNEQLQKVNEYNFDHPDAFDTELLLSCMEKLRHGRTVSIPNYDFKTHKSTEPARMVNPSDVIILEGILVLHDSRELHSVQGQLVAERSRCAKLEAQIGELQKMLESLPPLGREVEALRSEKSAFERDMELAAAVETQRSGGIWKWVAG